MQIVEAIFNAVTTAIGNIASSLVEGAESLMYIGTGETRELSTLALIVFTFVGISIAFTLIKWVLGLVKLG